MAEQAFAPQHAAPEVLHAPGAEAWPLSAAQSAVDGSPAMLVQRRRIGAAFGPAARMQVRPGDNRTGLPDGLKAGIESLSGMDVSDVRVHRNSGKPAQLNALAYAQGNEIHLGPGQEQHLAHEAWHVVQQRQGRVQATTQLAGTAVNDEASLENEADVMGGQAQRGGPAVSAGAVQRAAATDAVALLQRKKFDFEGHSVDSGNLDAFRNFCTGMARVNPQRLRDLGLYLIHNEQSLTREEILTMTRMLWTALGLAVPPVNQAIPQAFQVVIDAFERLRGQVTRPDAVARTLRAAAIVHANADLIALAGPEARRFVYLLIGEQPETGFDNESSGAIQQRTGVVLTAWSDLPTDPDRIGFFNGAFGSDPCVCARLNGVAEFVAMRVENIPASALEDAPYDTELSQRILELAEAFFKDDEGEEHDWAAFRRKLVENHQDIAEHEKFSGSFKAARDAFL